MADFSLSDCTIVSSRTRGKRGERARLATLRNSYSRHSSPPPLPSASARDEEARAQIACRRMLERCQKKCVPPPMLATSSCAPPPPQLFFASRSSVAEKLAPTAEFAFSKFGSFLRRQPLETIRFVCRTVENLDRRALEIVYIQFLARARESHGSFSTLARLVARRVPAFISPTCDAKTSNLLASFVARLHVFVEFRLLHTRQ